MTIANRAIDPVAVLSALGGAANVLETEPCITRMRIRLVDPDLVDEEQLKELGAFGVVRTGHTVQVVVGPKADSLTNEVAQLLANSGD